MVDLPRLVAGTAIREGDERGRCSSPREGSCPPSRRDEVGKVNVRFAELHARFFEPQYGLVAITA